MLLDQDVEEALRYFDELRRMNMVDSYHYAVMIEQVGDVASATSFLEEMVGRGLQAQCACHNSILKKFCLRGELEQAEEYFLRMKADASISPNYRTYCHLILAHSEGNNRSRCEELFEDMAAAHLSSGYKSWEDLVRDLKIKMETTALQEKLKSSSEGRVQELERLMRKNLVDVVTFNLVLNSSKTAEQARELWEKVKRIDLLPDITSYKIFLKILCAHAHFQEAEEILQEVMERGMENNKIYTRLISGYNDAGRAADADRIFRQAKDRGFLERHQT
eukprot:764675-Hanusia_phi.AAC.2